MMRQASFLLFVLLLLAMMLPTVTTASPGPVQHQADEGRRPEFVDVLYFEATRDVDSVLLEWETGFEPVGLEGFYVRRTTDPAAQPQEAEAISGLLPAAGDPNGAFYDYTDKTVSSDVTTYYYWLEVVDNDPEDQFEGPAEATLKEIYESNYLPVILKSS